VFDLDTFLAELVEGAAGGREAARATLERALSAAGDVAAALTPNAGGITLLHHTPALTVINVAWAPKMRIIPHEHLMWAVIGIYAGAEDNQFYRRDGGPGLVETNGKRLETGDVAVLGTRTIHSVSNPTARLTGAVHVYGGDFVNQPRSQWGPGERTERAYAMADINRQFHEANIASGLTDTP
jgi:predicted metal-dependent enzyme (double-stranded beta helix superfamily)